MFLSRVSTLTRDIDIANLSLRPSVVCLSVRYLPVPDENGLTYRHSFQGHDIIQRQITRKWYKSYIYNGGPIESRIWSIERRHFQ